MAETLSSRTTHSEGKIVQLFRVRMRGIFEQFVQGISIEKFAEIYGDVVREKKVQVKLLKRWQDAVLKSMVEELDEIIKDEKLDEKLNRLATIIENGQFDRNKIAWRPPGNPTEHMRSLDMQAKMEMKRELERYVNQKEAIVQCLKKKVIQGRTEAENLKMRLDTQLQELESKYETEKRVQSHLFILLDQQTNQDADNTT